MVSGFVGFASIAASLAVPVYLLMRDGLQLTPTLGFALACAALVIYTHRGNIARMRAGTRAACTQAVVVRARWFVKPPKPRCRSACSSASTIASSVRARRSPRISR